MTRGDAFWVAPPKYGFTIPLLPPSKNDLMPSPAVVYVRARREYVPIRWLQLKDAQSVWSRWVPPAGAHRAQGRRRLTFTVLRPKGMTHQDEWNITTGLNLVVLDDLVRKGWLVDDRERYVDLPRVVQRRPNEGEAAPMTLIEIEDLPCPG